VDMVSSVCGAVEFGKSLSSAILQKFLWNLKSSGSSPAYVGGNSESNAVNRERSISIYLWRKNLEKWHDLFFKESDPSYLQATDL
jgi:hypothetical protein